VEARSSRLPTAAALVAAMAALPCAGIVACGQGQGDASTIRSDEVTSSHVTVASVTGSISASADGSSSAGVSEPIDPDPKDVEGKMITVHPVMGAKPIAKKPPPYVKPTVAYPVPAGTAPPPKVPVGAGLGAPGATTGGSSPCKSPKVVETN
jgi:hypothetical protein